MSTDANADRGPVNPKGDELHTGDVHGGVMRADGELGFRVSSFCNGGTCVEVAPLADGHVAVRSGQLGRPTLVYSAGEWRDFVAGVKNGEFDFA